MFATGQIIAIVVVLIIVIIASWIYFRSTIVKCNSKVDLSGRIAIVTGANTGIGFYTALDFAKRNAKVIMACRNLEKAEAARDEIITMSGNKKVVVYPLDLCMMSSVREFVQKVYSQETRLDILVNNAGVVNTGKPREVTPEGLETIFAINYYGPFLLTLLLLDLMKKAKKSRIVNVSSVVNKFGAIDFTNLQAEKSFAYHFRYFDSKLAIILFTRELAKRLEGTGVTVNALHPGSVYTDLLRNLNPFIRIPILAFMRLFCKTAEEGAQTSIFLAVSEDVENVNGKYFVECDINERECAGISRNMELAAKLWGVTEELLGLPKTVDDAAIEKSDTL